MDVQLWSLAGYKDVSSVAHNEVGSAAICVWRSWLGMSTSNHSYIYIYIYL